MANPLNATDYGAFPVYNGLAPAGDGEKPKALVMSFNMAAQAAWDVDLYDTITGENVTTVQALFFDNPGAQKGFLLERGSGITIRLPANSQGYLPFAMTQGAKLNISAPGSAAIIKLAFFNVPMPAFIWAA